MVGNSHKRDFLSVKVVVQDFQRLMTLLRETSLIHEHYTIDGQLKLHEIALTVDGTREHRLYLIRCSLAGTLVEMGVEGSEDSDVSEKFHL